MRMLLDPLCGLGNHVAFSVGTGYQKVGFQVKCGSGQYWCYIVVRAGAKVVFQNFVRAKFGVLLEIMCGLVRLHGEARTGGGANPPPHGKARKGSESNRREL